MGCSGTSARLRHRPHRRPRDVESRGNGRLRWRPRMTGRRTGRLVTPAAASSRRAAPAAPAPDRSAGPRSGHKSSCRPVPPYSVLPDRGSRAQMGGDGEDGGNGITGGTETHGATNTGVNGIGRRACYAATAAGLFLLHRSVYSGPLRAGDSAQGTSHQRVQRYLSVAAQGRYTAAAAGVLDYPDPPTIRWAAYLKCGAKLRRSYDSN